MEDALRWLWLLPTLAQVGLVARVLLSPDRRKHLFLVAWAILLIVVQAAGNLGHELMGRSIYFHFWIGAYLVLWSSIALALTEACNRGLAAYERFGEVGRRITRSILIGSGISILLLVLVLPEGVAERFQSYFQAQAYLVQGSLALLGLTVLAFALWSRLRLEANARRTMIAVTVLCAMQALLDSSLAAKWPFVLSLFGIAISTAAWLALAVLWSSQSDDRTTPDHSVVPKDVAPALAQMEAATHQLGDLVRRG